MKRIIIKGKIKVVTGILSELVKNFDGWTVDDYIWFASLKRRALAKNQKKF